LKNEKSGRHYDIENVWQDGEVNKERLMENIKLLFKLWIEDYQPVNCQESEARSQEPE